MKGLLAGLSGLLCGALGGLLAGCIASLCVQWYHISSFEGESGYYVVQIALGGILAGFILGAVTTLLVMRRQGSFAKGLGISIAMLLAVAAVSLGLAWLFGDIPPHPRRKQPAIAGGSPRPAGRLETRGKPSALTGRCGPLRRPRRTLRLACP